MSDIELRPTEKEEDTGALGPRVTEDDLRRIQAKVEAEVRQEEAARKELYARMAANMIIDDEPRGSYFVRNPGL
ncbi:MAG TPA: hypothetical protein VHA05_02870 [Candidatus Saccharimonadales bacterium]|nr:hypothetical protein [Candidatus Saccharimonadales bacterium]